MMSALVGRGDIRGMSFGFRVPLHGDKIVRDGANVIREVHAMDLKEITVTSIPAYTDTSLHLRVDPAIAGRIPAPATPAAADASAPASAAPAAGDSAPAPTPLRDDARRRIRRSATAR
jgi:hypothetical protein